MFFLTDIALHNMRMYEMYDKVLMYFWGFQRRRHSSTDASSISDNSKVKETPETHCGVHDEVDSDETADTVTKQVSSSSSASEQSSSKKFVIVPNCDDEMMVTAPPPNLDSSDIVGEEVLVVSSVLQELDEAANEAYNSEEDPDYKVSLLFVL